MALVLGDAACNSGFLMPIVEMNYSLQVLRFFRGARNEWMKYLDIQPLIGNLPNISAGFRTSASHVTQQAQGRPGWGVPREHGNSALAQQ